MKFAAIICSCLLTLFVSGCNSSAFKSSDKSPAKGDEPYPKIQDPVQDNPKQGKPKQDDPIQDDPIQDDPIQDDPIQDDPIQDDPIQEVPDDSEPHPGKDQTTQTPIETPIQITFECKCTPTQQDPTQQDPTQQDPTQQDPTQQDPTQQDPGQSKIVTTATQYIVKSPPKYGIITIVSTNVIVYTPNNGFAGQDTFTYVPKDAPDSSPATVQITVVQQ